IGSRRRRAQFLKGLVEPRLVGADLAEALGAARADGGGEGLQVRLRLLLQRLNGRLLNAHELGVEQDVIAGGVLVAVLAAASARGDDMLLSDDGIEQGIRDAEVYAGVPQLAIELRLVLLGGALLGVLCAGAEEQAEHQQRHGKHGAHGTVRYTPRYTARP